MTLALVLQLLPLQQESKIVNGTAVLGCRDQEALITWED